MGRFLCFFYDKIINMINERKDHIRIQKKIYLNILQTLGRITPEAGGILGYREKIICDYYFDETAKNNINEYHPTDNVGGCWDKDMAKEPEKGIHDSFENNFYDSTETIKLENIDTYASYEDDLLDISAAVVQEGLENQLLLIC